MNNGDTDKLDWMYKGANSHIDQEEYLLGKSVDKSFEQITKEEKERKLGVVPPKNHVEHECIPPSIRDFNKIVHEEQVDLSAKLQEDPLMAIKKQEEEARRQFLQNPIQLKKLQDALKAQEDKKKKKKKRKRNYSDSEDDLDKQIAEKLKNLKGNFTSLPNKKKKSKSEHLDTILMHKFNQLKDKLSQEDMDDILAGKSSDSDDEVSKKKAKGRSSSEDDGDDKEKTEKLKKYNGKRDQEDKHNKYRRRSSSESRHERDETSQKHKYSQRSITRDRSKEKYRSRRSSSVESDHAKRNKTYKYEKDRDKRKYRSRERSRDQNTNTRSSSNEDMLKTSKKPNWYEERSNNKKRISRNSSREKVKYTKSYNKDSDEERQNPTYKYDKHNDRTATTYRQTDRKHRNSSSGSECERSSKSSKYNGKKDQLKIISKDRSKVKEKSRRNSSSQSEDERGTKTNRYDKHRSRRSISKDKNTKTEKRKERGNEKQSESKRNRNSSNESNSESSKEESTNNDLERMILEKLKMLREFALDKTEELENVQQTYSHYDSDNDEFVYKKKSFGLVKSDGTKIPLKNPPNDNKKLPAKKIEPPKLADVKKNQNKRLTDKEKEELRKQMMADAVHRDKERSDNLKKHRHENQKEDTKIETFDKNFVHRELYKGQNDLKDVESRIKSKLNNIQRSSQHMNSNFSKRS